MSPETWKSFTEHVIKLEDSLWELNSVVDSFTDDTKCNSEQNEDKIMAGQLPPEAKLNN